MAFSQNSGSKIEASDRESVRLQKKLLSSCDLNAVGISYCSTHLARLEVQGKFPKRVRIGENRIAWVAAEIEAWIDARIAERAEASLERWMPGDGV
jgi:prophage regulatory protein